MGWSLSDIDALGNDLTETMEWMKGVIYLKRKEDKEIEKAERKARRS